MVSSIVGNYLVNKGIITAEQLNDLLLEQRKVRVKLGLIAVAEGFMTQEEADRVNRLQAVMDKRFGDIAVEKKYLTEGQVEELLKKQGNAYLTFAQALENQQLMTIEQLEQYLVDFKCENRFSNFVIEDLKSDDVDRILPHYIPLKCEHYLNIAGTALRILIRCIDAETYPEQAYLASEIEAENGALQCMEGEHNITCAIAGKQDELLHTASVFGQENFNQVNEDALDAIGELLNCINGLHASALSQGGNNMELLPPEFSADITKLCSKEMLVLPVNIKGNQFKFIMAIDNSIEMK